ncbi:ATP-grasp domain-containing protein [Candidatus Parcubacteria bacterium]|nr:ATP-grasp domain-containing protein [Candidatus Parcubacteria bacterium]
MNIELTKPLVYVARDIERALGMEPRGGYFIISNDAPYGRGVRERFPDNVRLVGGGKNGDLLDTYDLLSLPEVVENISKLGADVVVFQNTPRIERLAKEKGWNLVNPSADLAKKVEEKISQVEWLGEDASLLPPHEIARIKDVKWRGERFVLQFNHSHTGQGTYIIDSADALAGLAAKFPERDCRVSDFIDGPVFTVNAVVAQGSRASAVVGAANVIVGNPSYQITGLAPFTDLPFSTIGNDWALPQKKEYEKASRDIKDMAERAGRRMARDGWRGLFGIDMIFDEKTGRSYLLEINARQPASAAFESILQKQAVPDAPSIFEAHIAALLGKTLSGAEKIAASALAPISGAQIVKRVTEKRSTVDIVALRAKGLAVMEYQNSAPNKELFRIQSAEGIMESRDALNELGKFIASCIR